MNTKSQCIKESSTLGNIAAMKQLQREILKNTKSQYIKESSTLAKISDKMNQLQMGNHKKTQQKLVHGCVKHCSHKADEIRLPKVSTELNTIANIAAINKLQCAHLQNTIRKFM